MAPTRQRTGDVIVVILGGGRGSRLDPLTRLRSKPAVPLAGKFRLIDVPISNAINSNMKRVFVLTQFNSVSLHRHIGETYRFDAFTRGFVQILAAQQTPAGDGWFQGTADAVRQNLRFVKELPGDLVLILSGDHIYRMDYRDMLQEHLMQGADITIAMQMCSEAEIADFGASRVDDTGRVVEFREKPASAQAREGMAMPVEALRDKGLALDRPYLASMGIYLFRKDVLVELLNGHEVDFGRHIIPGAVAEHRVQAFPFEGYWRDIGTIRSFYDAHMDLIGANPPFDFYDPKWPFFTHARFLPGTRLDGSTFRRTMMAEGSIITDSTVEDSIIGVRTRIDRATVRRSLVMGSDPFPPAGPGGVPPVGIGEGSLVENAIVDKNARIGRNVQIVNAAGIQDADGLAWAVRDGIVVVAKGAVIPDGTVI